MVGMLVGAMLAVWVFVEEDDESVLLVVELVEEREDVLLDDCAAIKTEYLGWVSRNLMVLTPADV